MDNEKLKELMAVYEDAEEFKSSLSKFIERSKEYICKEQFLSLCNSMWDNSTPSAKEQADKEQADNEEFIKEAMNKLKMMAKELNVKL